MNTVNNDLGRTQARFELIWWLFTAVLVVAVLAPIYLHKLYFPFYLTNILFVVTFVTVTRYTFFLKYTWLARKKWIKVGIIMASAILIFVFATSMIDFNNYIEEVGLQEVVKDLPASRQYPMIRYIQREVIFFAMGSMIGLGVFSLRLIISLWRMRNSVTKV